MTMMVGAMRRMSVLLCALAIAGAGPAWAVSNPWTTFLTGGSDGNVQVKAQVDFVGGLYPYKFTYTLTFTVPPPAWTLDLTYFTVGNPDRLPFFNAGNSASSTYFKIDPTYSYTKPKTSVSWTASVPYPVSQGPISFWYQGEKRYYKEVSASVGGEGKSATGQSLGMNAPEPTTLASIGIGLIGIGLSLKRRRDLSKR